MTKFQAKVALIVAVASLFGGVASAMRDDKPEAPPKPTPIGNPGEWFPADAYPQVARDINAEGRTAFSLDIDAAGRIMTCNIVESSGSAILDSTTCSLLISNGRFKPALDKKGKPVAGTWSSAMRWKLTAAPPPPETEEAPPPKP